MIIASASNEGQSLKTLLTANLAVLRATCAPDMAAELHALYREVYAH